jgi:hypothetical protein
MFDCIIKKSEIKEESYNYEYESKTSQNIIRAESDEVDNENNYELSNDGICLQNCSQCTETRCIKCKKNYELLGNKSNDEIICVNKSLLNIGYYKDENTSIYYKCGDNCERCLNDINCIKCNNNYTKINNTNSTCYLINDLTPYYLPDSNDEYNYLSCNYIYKNCLTCNSEQCLSCQNEYFFRKNNYRQCLSIAEIEDLEEEEEKETHREQENQREEEKEKEKEKEKIKEEEEKKNNLFKFNEEEFPELNNASNITNTNKSF